MHDQQKKETLALIQKISNNRNRNLGSSAERVDYDFEAPSLYALHDEIEKLKSEKLDTQSFTESLAIYEN